MTTHTVFKAADRRKLAASNLTDARPSLVAAMKAIDGLEGHSTAQEAMARAVSAVDDAVHALASYEALEAAPASGYAVLEVGPPDGPSGSIHHAEVYAQGFETVEEAHAFACADPRRCQLVFVYENGTRRWLTADEDVAVQRAIVETFRGERS